MEQVRIPISELKAYLAEKLAYRANKRAKKESRKALFFYFFTCARYSSRHRSLSMMYRAASSPT